MRAVGRAAGAPPARSAAASRPASAVEDARAAPVDLAQPAEVRRVAAERRRAAARRTRPRRGAASSGLVAFSRADGGGPLGAGRGGAERPGAVGGPHRGRRRAARPAGAASGTGRGPAPRCGPAPSRSVRAADADDQRPAGEHPDRRGAVEQQERQVLVGVPGRGQRAQGQPAQVDLVAVAQAAVVERRGRPAAEARTCAPSSAASWTRAGQEVGVQVGVGGERDPQPAPVGGRAHRAQVARRVDRQRPRRRRGRPGRRGCPAPRRPRGISRPSPCPSCALPVPGRRWRSGPAPTLFHGTLEDVDG